MRKHGGVTYGMTTGMRLGCLRYLIHADMKESGWGVGWRDSKGSFKLELKYGFNKTTIRYHLFFFF